MRRQTISIEHLDKVARRILAPADPTDSKGLAITPHDLWEAFVDYYKYIAQTRWERQEMIKGGDHAGTIVGVGVSTPLTVESFVLFAGISHRVFKKYVNMMDSPDTTESLEYIRPIARFIREIIAADQLEGAMVGAYDTNITGAILGLAKRTELTGAGGTPLEVKTITGMEIK